MAPTLLFQDGSYKGTAVKFKNVIVIGSADSANLKLDEQGISPLHIAFIKGSDGFYILNLDENNHIYLNSEPIQTSRVNNEDIITITENCTLKFTMEKEEYNSFTSPPTQNNSKKNIANTMKKNTTEQINEIKHARVNSSFLKKAFIIIAWIVLIIFLFIVSFITGIYTTDSILQIK